ncbi:hypothetical protein MTO96_043363 [Rhipicephalus appendiculatus]
MEASSAKVVDLVGESDGDLASSMPLPEDSAAHDDSAGDETAAPLDIMVREIGRMSMLERATAHVVSIDTWKGQLDFERACSAVVSGERCWLSGELTSWNRVLNSLEYEFVETRPGSVRLQKADCYSKRSSQVQSSSIAFKFAAELESLLRRNASTLKSVTFTEARLPRNVDYALRCLVNCESLTLYARGRRDPSLVSVAQLLRTTSALKNLSINICPNQKEETADHNCRSRQGQHFLDDALSVL